MLINPASKLLDFCLTDIFVYTFHKYKVICYRSIVLAKIGDNGKAHQ